MEQSAKNVSVLFVCMGNICRSPTAEGVFRKLVADAELAEQVRVDSAGTHAYHGGEPPDRRAQHAAEQRGYSLSDITARKISVDDFETFDYVLAMDEDNLFSLRQTAAGTNEDRIRLFLEFGDSGNEREVPDPYYGGTAGFERVLDLVEDAARGLLDEVRTTLKS